MEAAACLLQLKKTTIKSTQTENQNAATKQGDAFLYAHFCNNKKQPIHGDRMRRKRFKDGKLLLFRV